MQKYSFFGLLKHALRHHEDWAPVWREPAPKRRYEVVVVGGGGHGLATAYYLAKNHGIADVAVVEKGWLGGGNTGRNTTIVRSNYLRDEAAQLYEFALKRWEGLSRELNFNVMFSPRGVLNLGHTPAGHARHRAARQRQSLERHRRRGARPGRGAGQGAAAELLAERALPGAWRVLAAARRGGAATTPWPGASRAPPIPWAWTSLQNTEVGGIRIADGAAKGVETNRGFIAANKVACVAAGHSGVLAAMAGLRLPIESRPLQALVSEPLKPCLDTVVMSNAVHCYISQADKGDLVIGAGTDAYNGYGQRGSFHVVEHALQAVCDLFPAFSRVRMNRQWGGIVDICPDACPIIGKTPIAGLYFNCGWGTGGFKATPGSGYVFADTVAHDRPHPLAEPFALERFHTGALIDEHGAAGVAH